MKPFSDRRATFAKALGTGVAVIPGARLSLRNRDTEYEFRQSSDFYYLTGFTEPDAVLVMVCADGSPRSILFTLPRDRAIEVWTGKRHGIEGAIAQFGFDEAFEIKELDTRLPELLHGHDTLFYSIGGDEALDRRVLASIDAARSRNRRGGGITPESITNPYAILHEMRLIKSEDEVATMRRAGAITRLGHIAGMQTTRPGMPEYELEAAIEFQYGKNGAQSVAYPSIVAGGANATILHYSTNREALRGGDLVLVDSGCELDLYASDVTRTWPVNGKFSAEQRAIYDIVLAAQKAGIACVRPGNRYADSHDAAVRVIVDGLVDLGLLRGNAEELIESKAYQDFYYHSTGHWIGLDVHDVGRYRDVPQKTHRVLEAGMTLTVEPGLYVPLDLQCAERFKGIGVRIEDDILCSANGPDVLSDNIPKEIAEIEAIVGKGSP